jgi:SAM-dependent methyltransferase
MHPSALLNAKIFFQTYTTSETSATVVDIGAQNVNGSMKDVAPRSLRYIGVDFINANGVDVVLTDPYSLPFENESVDIVVSSSCLEHSEMFWVLYLEVLRILKPGGLFYINVPTNGDFHRYPVDCWRFYPDSGQALVTWAKRNGYQPLLLESFVDDKYMGIWNDYVAVFLKDEKHLAEHPRRMIEAKNSFTNGMVAGRQEVLRERKHSPDQFNFIDRIKRRYWRSKERAMLNSLKLK